MLLGLFHWGIRIRRRLTISFNPRTFFRIQNIHIRLLLQYKEIFFRIRHLHFGAGFVLPFTSRRVREIEMKMFWFGCLSGVFEFSIPESEVLLWKEQKKIQS